MIVAGSGGIVHNLRRLDIRNKDAAVEPWATEFDEWVAKTRRDAESRGFVPDIANEGAECRHARSRPRSTSTRFS